MGGVTVSQVAKQIKEKRGNIAAVARALGTTRQTVYDKIQKFPKLQTILADARETMLDNAETTLYDEALNGNVTALIFFLKTQGKSRGYTERQEVQHDGGFTVNLSWGDEPE